ncbi:MAG: IS1182 family transposase [Erysipelotrichaceae bacterium]|nr:IS1182 family transposase [Erysipelotrichaceae bacterium]
MTNFLAHSNYITTQIQLPLDLEITFKVSDEVITFNNLIKDIDFNKFFITKDIYYTETRGRKKKSRANILKAILFAFSIGVRSTRDIADLCKHDTRFMFLLDRIDPPSHTTINNTINSLLYNIDDVLVEINKRIIKEDSSVDLNTLYVDGTKLEAYANKYTFVWKKAILKFQAKLNLKIIALLPRLNDVFINSGYNPVALKEQYSSIELLEIVDTLTSIIEKYGILLVYGKGKRKHEEQRLYDLFIKFQEKMNEYEEHLKTIGDNRNSYSKTDPDATFMRMKDDHMMNGQLKAGYNMQIAVADEYIMALELYQERSDFRTFIPFIDHFNFLYGHYLERIVADAGYGNFDNYKFCIDNTIEPFIKYSWYRIEQTSKFKRNPFKKQNFIKDKDGNYICPNGKTLTFEREQQMRYSRNEAYEQIFRCHECDDCPDRAQCTTSKYGRTITMNEQYDEYKQRASNNLQSEAGIKLRVLRSIQVEGAFGVMKENMKYRRFNRRSYQKARLEATLVAIGMNISKYHNKKYRIIN